MMGKSGWMTGSLLGAAMLIGSAAVAQTQPRYNYPDANEQDGGDLSREDDASGAAQQDDAAPQEPSPDEDFSDVVAADEQRAETPANGAARSEQQSDPALSVEDREAETMTDACAIAARDEAERDGGYAEVRQMETPRESRNGFIIDGDVEARSGWRAQDGQVRHFSCTIANGRVEDVYFQRERAAR